MVGKVGVPCCLALAHVGSVTYRASLRAFGTSSYSEITLISQDRSYPAHRIIVCQQSSVIAKKCQFQDDAQGSSGDLCRATPSYSFDFLEDEPLAVDCLVQYFYRQNYQCSSGSSMVDDGHSEEFDGITLALEQDRIDDSYPILHARVYALAEVYDIPGLKELALKKFNEVINQNEHLDRLLDSIKEAYTSTVPEDRGMRDDIVKFLYTNAKLLDEESVKNVLQDITALPYDLVMYWRNERVKHPWG